MTEPSGRSVVERFARALQNKDFDELEALVTDDFTDEMPQSGERVRGKTNQLAILRNYPGGVGTIDPGSARLVGAEDRWVMTPSFTALRGVGRRLHVHRYRPVPERRNLADDRHHRTPPGKSRQDDDLVCRALRGP